jgi:hypothetical protein
MKTVLLARLRRPAGFVALRILALGILGLAGLVCRGYSAEISKPVSTTGTLPAAGLKKGVMVAKFEVGSPPATPGQSAQPAPTPPSAEAAADVTERLVAALAHSDGFALITWPDTLPAPPADPANPGAVRSAVCRGANTLGADLVVFGAVEQWSQVRSTGRSASQVINATPETGAVPDPAPAPATRASSRNPFSLAKGVAGNELQRMANKPTESTEAVAEVLVRIYRASSGELLHSGRIAGRAKSVTLPVRNISTAKDPFEQAANDAVAQAVKAITGAANKLESTGWEGRVVELEVENDNSSITLYVNGGSKRGLKAGDELDIVRPGADIVEAKTGLVLGRKKDKFIGRCKVESVTADLATARATEGTDFQKEDLARPRANAPKSR